MSVQARVLVVDDEASNRTALERILVREDIEVVHAADGQEALQRVRLDRPHLMLTDFKMPGMSGLELLKLARSIAPSLEVIVMTAYGTVETAVEAMKEGAADFVTKPLRRANIVRAVRKALERRRLLMENQSLREELARTRSDELVGRSAVMQSLLEESRQVADSMASVLLTGDSGTGKGRLARWIHDQSPRRRSKLVTVNCGALPESLLESELFGHEAGAFTGARGMRAGRFDLARGGTLFLDEVTEMSPSLQVKLLRVLQDGEYERVGGTRTLQADVRILAATNRDPELAIREGKLREDLYYRLNVIRLHLPPLWMRRDDVPLLAQHFLQLHAARNRRVVDALSSDAVDALCAWKWPGNVRELENAIERAVVLCRGQTIEVAHLPKALRTVKPQPDALTFRVGTPLKEIERAMIEATLQVCHGDKVMTARLLGITARTIYRREAEWRMESDPEVG